MVILTPCDNLTFERFVQELRHNPRQDFFSSPDATKSKSILRFTIDGDLTDKTTLHLVKNEDKIQVAISGKLIDIVYEDGEFLISDDSKAVNLSKYDFILNNDIQGDKKNTSKKVKNKDSAKQKFEPFKFK